MTIKTAIRELSQLEQINFLLTNRIPRRYATLLMGWFSRIENPIVFKLSMVIWKFFGGNLHLEEAEKTRFTSLHDCFTRRLKTGVRLIDNRQNVITSPCDGIIGAFGKIDGTQLFQVKRFPYLLSDLLPDASLVEKYHNGYFVTIRLTSVMYHRFHAPCDSHVEQLWYVSGDTWNVNPIALKRIEKLYCKNERAVIELILNNPELSITMVPVAAILVASIKLNFLEDALDLNYQGPKRITKSAHFKKGDEMGYFQHGSTIIVFANHLFKIRDDLMDGLRIKMGEPLLFVPEETSTSQ